MLKNKNVVMGISGGIAVYKAVDVVSRLKKLGANIDVIMTDSATKFVTPLTFQSLSQNNVTVDMFRELVDWDIEHIALAKKADIFLVVPATANIIGKIANGIADDMLSTTVMATRAKVIFAPAMNTQMYRNPIFKDNMNKLKQLGYEFIEPDKGRLACGDYGEGKLAQPIDIVNYVVNNFSSKKLSGKKIIVTAGPTIEPIDPVRYITNHSSGKMGYEIAKKATEMGADVILISGPTYIEKPEGLKLIKVKSTEDMLNEINKYFDECDVLIKAAAPLDYKPVNISDKKIKKGSANLSIEFKRNPDILKYFGGIKNKQILVGFAAETNDLIKNAVNKVEKKRLDFIVANNVAEKDSGFKSDTNIVTIIDKYGNKENYPKMLKKELAQVILNKVVNII